MDLLNKAEIVSTACRPRSEGPLSSEERASCVAANIQTGYDSLQNGPMALTCWDDLAGSEDEWIGESRFYYTRSLTGVISNATAAGHSESEIRAGALEAAEIQCAANLDSTDNPNVSLDRCKTALVQEAVRLIPRGLKPGPLPEGVELRAWHEDDADDYAAIMTNPRVWEFLPDNGELDQLSSIDAASMISAINAGSHHKVFAIVVDGRPAGQLRVIFHPTVAGVRSAEVVYMLSDEFWGRGLMSHILPAFVARCFDDLCLDVLVAWIHPDNVGSARCAERAGFFRNHSRYEAELATAVERDGFQQYLAYRLDFELKGSSSS